MASSAHVLCAAAILAVCAAAGPQGVCYTMARSQKTVAETKSRGQLHGRRWVTTYYLQYARKAVLTPVARCCRGYRLDSKGFCQQLCYPGCPAPKVCVAPNRCQCPGNLVEDSGGQCVQPLCLNRVCEHGRCDPASGECVCESGYGWQGKHISTSVFTNRSLTSNSCSSCGYELTPNGTHSVGTCQPVCASGCPDGTCVAPDTCECGAGFQPGRRADGAATCVAAPRCWEHGYYAGRDTCRCLQGYQLTQAAGGLPTCQPDCRGACGPRAHCVAPDTCTCVQGYSDERSIEEVQENVAIRCVPKCVHGCDAGRCVSPNECECPTSFPRVKSYRCANASCHSLNRCRCWPGYELVQGDSSTCQPHCDPSCGNGTCAAPNRCICFEGYELTRRGCVPRCRTGCGFGTCVAPDRCECWPGYEAATSETGQVRCVPVCTPPCVHGNCAAPNVCECWRGYRLAGPGCRPECSQPCYYADCVEPDTCRCWDGFGPVPGNGSACRPACNATCVNATCTAPDTCTCLEGLVRDGADPSGARCGPPCPEHLCSQGEHACLADAEDRDCVCSTGRKRPPCVADTAPHVAWPLLLPLLLLVPALATVALLAFLHVRNRRKAPADVPPHGLSTSTSGGTSPKNSTSDEYDDASGYCAARFPLDTKKLIRHTDTRRGPNGRVSHNRNTELGGLYKGIGGGRRSPIYGQVGYGEVGYAEIGDRNVPSDLCELEPNSVDRAAVQNGGQMAENEFYGDAAGTEWCRASVHQIQNDLYVQHDSKPQRNTLAPGYLDVMYAKVVKKGNGRSSARIVDNDFYNHPSRNTQETNSGNVIEYDTASEALHQKSITHQMEGNYEEVPSGFGHPVELRKRQKTRPPTQEEDQQYEEIGDVGSREVTKMVENDLYRGCGSGVNSNFIVQEGRVEYEEIVDGTGRGPGDVVDNGLYGQRWSSDGKGEMGAKVADNEMYAINATDQQKRLRAKAGRTKKGSRKT